MSFYAESVAALWNTALRAVTAPHPCYHSGPGGVAMTTHAQQVAEEQAALDRLERACQRRQNAFLSINGQWLPQENVIQPAHALYELDNAEAEVRAAQADLDRIAARIRSEKQA